VINGRLESCRIELPQQRDIGDVRAIAPDSGIDPAFARALQRAARAGVKISALSCAAHLSGMELRGEIPVLLS